MRQPPIGRGIKDPSPEEELSARPTERQARKGQTVFRSRSSAIGAPAGEKGTDCSCPVLTRGVVTRRKERGDDRLFLAGAENSDVSLGLPFVISDSSFVGYRHQVGPPHPSSRRKVPQPLAVAGRPCSLSSVNRIELSRETKKSHSSFRSIEYARIYHVDIDFVFRVLWGGTTDLSQKIVYTAGEDGCHSN